MSRQLIVNPYAGINWDKVTRKIGDLQQHSTESDGREHPAVLIDQMVEFGRDMVCITDHDSYRVNKGKFPKVLAVPTSERPDGRFINTFPLSAYEGDVYFDPLSGGNYTELARKGTVGEFARDEKGVMPNGLLAIEGNEVTAVGSGVVHDFLSLFTDYDGFPASGTIEDKLQAIKDINGMSIFAHPWKYEFSVKWYKDRLKEYFPSTVGVENDKASFELWDNLITLGFDILPIWGFSNTDSHYGVTNTRYNVFFMEELSENELKNRIINGNFYSCHGAGTALLAPVITRIDVNEVSKEITISTGNGVDIVKWVSCGKVIHIGNKLNYSTVKGISKYVRAEVINKNGFVSLTNPFYFNRFIKPRFV